MENKDFFLNKMRDELLQWLQVPQRKATAVEGLMITRIDQQKPPENCLYYPLIALVVQGRKQAFYGEREVSYGKGEYVVLGSDMPGIFQVLDSSPDNPFLSLSIRLDPHIIASLNVECPSPPVVAQTALAPIGKEEASEELLLAFYRLLRLLRQPENLPFLAPSILREIHFYILKGSLGGKLRLATTPGTRDNRIAKSLAWFREHFRESISMPELAEQVNMAPSTFNRCFREITSISPLQFQKRLRLYEAQRLMLLENLDARAASLEVGYESEAQFSREYKRLFGQPPGRHLSGSRPQ